MGLLARERIGRIHAGLVGVVVLVETIESCLARSEFSSTSLPHCDRRDAGRAARQPDRVEGRDILIFGDSLLMFEMLPGVIRNLVVNMPMEDLANSAEVMLDEGTRIRR